MVLANRKGVMPKRKKKLNKRNKGTESQTRARARATVNTQNNNIISRCHHLPRHHHPVKANEKRVLIFTFFYNNFTIKKFASFNSVFDHCAVAAVIYCQVIVHYELSGCLIQKIEGINRWVDAIVNVDHIFCVSYYTPNWRTRRVHKDPVEDITIVQQPLFSSILSLCNHSAKAPDYRNFGFILFHTIVQ